MRQKCNANKQKKLIFLNQLQPFEGINYFYFDRKYDQIICNEDFKKFQVCAAYICQEKHFKYLKNCTIYQQHQFFYNRVSKYFEYEQKKQTKKYLKIFLGFYGLFDDLEVTSSAQKTKEIQKNFTQRDQLEKQIMTQTKYYCLVLIAVFYLIIGDFKNSQQVINYLLNHYKKNSFIYYLNAQVLYLNNKSSIKNLKYAIQFLELSQAYNSTKNLINKNDLYIEDFFDLQSSIIKLEEKIQSKIKMMNNQKDNFQIIWNNLQYTTEPLIRKKQQKNSNKIKNFRYKKVLREIIFILDNSKKTIEKHIYFQKDFDIISYQANKTFNKYQNISKVKSEIKQIRNYCKKSKQVIKNSLDNSQILQNILFQQKLTEIAEQKFISLDIDNKILESIYQSTSLNFEIDQSKYKKIFQNVVLINIIVILVYLILEQLIINQTQEVFSKF